MNPTVKSKKDTNKNSNPSIEGFFDRTKKLGGNGIGGYQTRVIQMTVEIYRIERKKLIFRAKKKKWIEQQI